MQDAKFLTTAPATSGRQTHAAHSAKDSETHSDAPDGYAAEWAKLSTSANDAAPTQPDAASQKTHGRESQSLETVPLDIPTSVDAADQNLIPAVPGLNETAGATALSTDLNIAEAPTETPVEPGALAISYPTLTETADAPPLRPSANNLAVDPLGTEKYLQTPAGNIQQATVLTANTLQNNATPLANPVALSTDFQTIKFGTTPVLPEHIAQTIAPQADIAHTTDADILLPETLNLASDLDSIQAETGIKTNQAVSQSALLADLSSEAALNPLKGLDLSALDTRNALTGLTPVNMNSAPTVTASSPTVIPPAVQTLAVTTVAQAIATAHETAKGVQVQLDPPEMGRVYIDFSFDGDRNVTVIVKAENPDTQLILRERADQFVNLLKESGLDNINLSFESHHKGQNPNFQNDGQASTNPTFFTPETQNASPQLSSLSSRHVPSDGSLDIKL